MMDGLRVPPVRSRVMWAAVSLATRWDGGTARRIGMVVWFVTAAGGLTLLIHGIATRSWAEVLGSLRSIAPVNEWPRTSLYFGGVHAVAPGGDVAADPRRDGAARIEPAHHDHPT